MKNYGSVESFRYLYKKYIGSFIAWDGKKLLATIFICLKGKICYCFLKFETVSIMLKFSIQKILFHLKTKVFFIHMPNIIPAEEIFDNERDIINEM